MTKNYCCKECGGLICLLTARYGSGLCLSCANSGKRNPMFGSKKTAGKNNAQYIDGRSLIIRNCSKCGKKLSSYISKQCKKCYQSNMKGKNHPGYKIGKHKCIDCGKNVSDYKSIRCKKCFIKYKKKNIKPKITYCCSDCGNKISYPTAMNGKGRCIFCAKIGQNHPLFGSQMKASSKHKISKSLKGKYCGEKSPAFKDGRTLRKHYCKCGNEISYHSKYHRSGKCSSCSQSGKNNGNYIHGNGYAPYPVMFNTKLKDYIRDRDEHRCQICGLKEKNNYRMSKFTKLPIHHIDYNKQNCSENNLICLCNKCHTKTNFNRDYWYAYFRYIMENLK